MPQSIGTVLIDVQADTQKLVQGFDRAEKTVSKTTDTMKKAVLGLTTAYLSLEGVNAFTGMVKGSIDAADSLSELAEKLNISVSGLSELQYVSGFAGVSIGQLNAAMSAMIRRTGNFKADGTGAAVKALEELGISVDFARQNFTDTESTFNILIDRLRGVEDGTLRTKLAQDLFSKSASDVVRLANMSANEIRVLGDEGHRTGAIFTDEFAENAGKVNDSLDKLGKALEGRKNNLATELTPALIEATDGLRENIPLIIDTAKEITHLAIVLGSTTLAFKAYNIISKTVQASNLALGGTYGAVNRSILLATVSTKAFNTVLRATPFGIATTAVYLLSDAFLDNADKAELLEDAYNGTSENLKNLTKNQLEYRQSLVETELIQARLELANAKADVGSNGFFESEQEKKKDLAHLDEVRQRFENLTKTSRELKNALKGVFSEDSNNTKIKKLTDSQINKNLSSWETYYEKVENYEEAWRVKQQQLAKQYEFLPKEKLDEFLSVLEQEYFIKVSVSDDLEGGDYLSRQIQAQKDQEEYTKTMFSDAFATIADPIDVINEKFMSMHDVIKDTFDEKQMKKFYKTWQKEIDNTNKDSDKYEGIGSKDWTSGLTGQAKDIANIGNAIADIGVEQEKWTEFSKEQNVTEQDKNMHLQNQFGLWGNVAGAISNMSEEGSTAAKVAQAAQTALAIANGVAAILNQGNGDPYTAFARIASMTALVASTLSSFGVSGGGGSGGSSSPISSSVMQESKFTSDLNEMTNQPILDRLDRQIELLEIIGKTGTTAATQASQAEVQFNYDLSQLAEEIIQRTQTTQIIQGVGNNWTDEQMQWVIDNQFQRVNDVVGATIYNISDDLNTITFNAAAFRDNMLEAMYAINEVGLLERLGNWQAAVDAGATTDEQIAAYTTAQGITAINDMQEAVSEYIVTMADSIEVMSDAKDTYKELFDEITNTNTYALKDYMNAKSEFESTLGVSVSSSNISNYLQTQIAAIDEIETLLGDSISNIFLSQDPNDLESQVTALNYLQDKLNTTFEGGVEDALNLVDAIELLSESLVTSRENITSFQDSFKTEDELALALSYSIGQDLATNYKQLNDIFQNFSSDMEGLTDTELEFLDANKAYIERIQEARLEALEEEYDLITSNIDSITSSIDKLNSASESLRTSALSDTTYAIDQYYASMRETLSLSKSSDYAAFADSLDKTISYTSALSDSSNFSNARDMQFAQLVAANQFDSMNITLDDELSYLEKIEQNTSNMIDALNNYTDSSIADITRQTTGFTSVNQIYQVVLGRDADKQGLNYWQDIAEKYGYDYVASRISNSIEADILGITPFATGGIVTAPTLGLIGEAGYNEAVIPLNNSNRMLGIDELIKEVQSLKTELQEIKTNTLNTADNTQSSRFVS